jgi:hypothetical protein
MAVAREGGNCPEKRKPGGGEVEDHHLFIAPSLLGMTQAPMHLV